MIGFYDYTVILTFLSLASSVFGMTQAMMGHYQMALCCLAFSGLCDAFDGKVARTKKNRTDDELMFGIQLDSLCDVVCFGVFPAMICYTMGVRGYLGGLALSYYCICAVVRLSFFNVLEIKRQQSDDPGEKIFHGLPVTSAAIIFPLAFLLSFWVKPSLFVGILVLLLFVVGTLFVLDFRMKKPSNLLLAICIVVVAAAVILLVLFADLKTPFSAVFQHIKDTLYARA